MDAAAYDRFRRTILVEQTRRGSMVSPEPKRFGKEIFAPDHKRARHARCLIAAYLRSEQLEVSRGDLDQPTVSVA